MHVDGVYCTFLPPGSVQTFTLNVGILLDDVPDPRGGALHYVPAGHKRMAQWLRDGGVPTAEAEAPDDIATLPGRPLCGKAGDAVIMHHLLPHRVGANDTGHMRSMLYFRVKHVEHERLKLDAPIDPWLEFPGVRRAHETSSAR
jgi:ectoine hydroxylase-related dioxygenase (phytanoyl-CoA dioxygenase family)